MSTAAVGHGRAATVRNFVVVTGSTLIGGLVNAVLVTFAARRGEIVEIAAFTTVSAVLAVVAVLVGGGSSSMLYISGSDEERGAIRSQRVLAVLPALALGAMGVVAVYAGLGYALAALVASSLVFLLNNLSELPLGQLYRDLRFMLLPVPLMLSKGAAVAAFLAGTPLTGALLVGAVVNLVVLEALVGAQSTVRSLVRERPTIAATRRAFGSTRDLYTYTVAELYTLRAPSIGLSLVVPVPVMGAFGAVAVVFQALLAVFQAGLFMLLSLRARARSAAGTHEPRRHDTEVLSLVAGLLGAVVIVGGAPILTADILRLDAPEASTWLQILGVAVPFVLLNRIVATRAVGDGRSRTGARIMVALAALTTLSLLVAVPLLGVLGGVLATLIAEVGVAVAIAVRRSRGPGRRSYKGRHRASAAQPPRTKVK